MELCATFVNICLHFVPPPPLPPLPTLRNNIIYRFLDIAYGTHHHQCVMGDTDLSAYELARLENIKQNRAALAALGLGGSASALTPIKKEKRKKEKAKRPRPPSSAPRTGQRQSRRLRSKTTDGSEEGHAREEEAEDAEEEEEEAEIVPQYVELLVFCSRPCGVWRVACG